jgi:hypothetical protein
MLRGGAGEARPVYGPAPGGNAGRGIVYGLVERGFGNDAGRLRLTFRYRVRSWTVVVQPGGTLDEVAAPACEAER